jgi:uncharacterized membrane protein
MRQVVFTFRGRTMSEQDHDPSVLGPPIRALQLEQPWNWLAKGWADYWKVPHVSIAYGVAIVAASYLLSGAVFYLWGIALVLPLAAGFLILAPLLAVGLYETSRRLESGEHITARSVMFVATSAPTQLAFVGITLTLLMLAWIRLATLLFALFFGMSSYPPLESWVGTLFFSVDGLIFLAVGSVIGGALAIIVFAISVVSIPLLMVRDVDAITAIVTSVRAVLHNPAPMLLWAWLIVVLTAVGIATLYVGLVVTYPLVGYATWHAYRSVVDVS